ncbi:MAG TPA: PLDc N-terminal domain-containing protein [Patescibacteria group bacterium]|nr:PLDc N-terminal domain-containing protein [Patescibacteria group bacterium]
MFGGIFALGAGIILLFFVAGILSFIFWIAMIVDCAKRKFKNETDKVVWILVLIFTGIIGALIYYFVVKRENK